ncbi:MAG: AraC family transcriptional regulator [Clostridium sp.]|nr:AraC family transcriptional regulator [Clostridium sp.]
MEQPYYKTIQTQSPMGTLIRFITTPGGYFPLHWHEELEILYPLNGEIDLRINGRLHLLNKKNLAVVESSQVHSTYAHEKTSMFLNIHLSKKLLESYLPDIELWQICCIPDTLEDEKFPEYRAICELMEELVRLYIMDTPVFALEAEGLVLQILARLLRNFAAPMASPPSAVDKMTMERIHSIITYTEEHYREPITLGDAAAHLGLGREYFCRFFKKNMEMSFLNYLNEIRLFHIYQELQNTDASVAEIMEANGFTNQKLFNRAFKNLYGHTPSAVRKMAQTT